MTDHMVCVTIDDQEVRCPAGCTVYEAATSAGIHIPTFCHHEKLEPVGACRMCLVEIEGAVGLQTSCTTPVREGMVVKVHTSPKAVKARKANIEFLLTNHPLDCPVCDKGGECPLQNQALLDGPGESRYIEAKRHKNKRFPLGELILIDQERCVLCWRCIRFLDEWADDHELDLFERGAETRIATFPERPLRSKWQGNTIDLCPVGALTSRVFRFEARVWELTETPSICPLCSVGCNIVLGVKNNRLRRITPRENREVNDTWICDKGRFGHGFVDHAERLKTPLIRRNGELQSATWNEALDLIAQRFQTIIQEHGPQTIAGLGSTRITNEANYLFQRFMRTVVGCNHIDHIGRMPKGAIPLSSLPDLEHKDVILLLGFDPSVEAPLVELWIKKAVLRHGARVIVANPRQIELGRYGGPWLGYLPGGETTLLNGLARAILHANAEGQPTRAGTRVTNLDEFRGWVERYSPDLVKRTTGVPADSLQQAARILAQARRPIILYGAGWAQRTPAEANIHAVANLALLLGDVEAGYVAEDNNTLGALEMGVVPDLYPGQQPFHDLQVRSRLASFWGGKLSPLEGWDFVVMMEAAEKGELQGMWIIGSDPASDCQAAGEALGRVPFLVVQDLFMTDTAALAEVVLPTASFAESDGSFFNVTGRLQVIQAGLRPPGKARPDWWIVSELAKRMVDSKRHKAWEFRGADDIVDEVAKALPGYRGVSLDRLGDVGWQRPAVKGGARRTFVRAESDIPPDDPGYPLRLVAGRLLYDRGTLMQRAGRPQNLVPDAFVLIHPADAGKLGLVDGDDASAVSSVGRLNLRVEVSEQVAPGVAYVPLNLSAAPLSVLFTDPWTLPRITLVKQESPEQPA